LFILHQFQWFLLHYMLQGKGYKIFINSKCNKTMYKDL
jgi:hypothetical protein